MAEGYASPNFRWSALDPTGEGRKDPVIKERLVKLAAMAEAFLVFVGVPSLTITPHGSYQPANAPAGWPSREPTSQHRIAYALDFYTPKGMTAAQFHTKARAFRDLQGHGGVGFYSWGAHLDLRKGKAQWGSAKPEDKA